MLFKLFDCEIEMPIDSEKLLIDFEYNEKIKNVEMFSNIIFILKSLVK